MNINKVVLYIYGAFLSEHQRTIPQVCLRDASAQTASMRRPDETAIADAARARTGGADIRAEGSREGRRGEKAQGG